jgi:hypothetical protein
MSNFECLSCAKETNGFPIHCAFCDRELDKPGALLISPPQPGSNRIHTNVIKMHLCCSCYEQLQVGAFEL